ncbi:hypothetical protein NKG05_20625 [Oerskovia sp. M15]
MLRRAVVRGTARVLVRDALSGVRRATGSRPGWRLPSRPSGVVVRRRGAGPGG